MQSEQSWAIRNTYVGEYWMEFPKGDGTPVGVMLFDTKEKAQAYAVQQRKKIPCDANESKVVPYKPE